MYKKNQAISFYLGSLQAYVILFYNLTLGFFLHSFKYLLAVKYFILQFYAYY